MSQGSIKEQNESLNRFHSAIGGEMLDGVDLSSPQAKQAMASIVLNSQSDNTDKSMSVSMVKKALGLGM